MRRLARRSLRYVGSDFQEKSSHSVSSLALIALQTNERCLDVAAQRKCVSFVVVKIITTLDLLPHSKRLARREDCFVGTTIMTLNYLTTSDGCNVDHIVFLG